MGFQSATTSVLSDSEQVVLYVIDIGIPEATERHSIRRNTSQFVSVGAQVVQAPLMLSVAPAFDSSVSRIRSATLS